MINKQFRQLKYNITPITRKPTDIKYIVVHYTANTNKYADDTAHYNYFNTGDRNASADYFVDKDSYIQTNDWEKNYTHHCGDGNAKYGITNRNSIAVEICVNDNIDLAIKNTIDVIKNDILQKLHHIDFNHVVRHYDASRKLCPIFFVDLNIKEIDPRWINFKNKIFSKNEKTYKTHKDILRECTDTPQAWIDIIDNNMNNDLFSYLPLLIQKVYYHNKNI